MLCNIPHCGFAGLFPDGWTWLTHGMAGVDPGVACEGAVPVHLSPGRDAVGRAFLVVLLGARLCGVFVAGHRLLLSGGVWLVGLVESFQALF